MRRDTSEYHLAELRIARDPSHPSHVNPPPLAPGKKILDIGCGAGQTLIATYPNRLAFGVDIDLDALKLGRTLTDQVAFTCARAEALPFASHSFDALVARVSIPLTNMRDSIREMRRVLKPGGLLWMTLHSFSIPWGAAKKANFNGRIFFLYILLNSFLFHVAQRQIRFPWGGYESFQTEKGIKRALRRAGFQEISVAIGRHFVVNAS